MKTTRIVGLLLVCTFLLMLCGCGKNLDNIPSLELIEEQGTEWANEKLVGYSREQLQEIWGEPDGMLSGFWGDIYHVPNSYMSVIVYYDADGVIELIKTDYRNG